MDFNVDAIQSKLQREISFNFLVSYFEVIINLVYITIAKYVLKRYTIWITLDIFQGYHSKNK